MQSLSLTNIVSLLLALFAIQISASPSIYGKDASAALSRRDTTITCSEYAMLANLSVIANNSTFRGAFIQAAPQGTSISEAFLSNISSVFSSLNLTFNQQLNAQCGNLTAVARAQAPKNFSMGIIGPFHVGAATALGAAGAAGSAVLSAAAVAFLMWAL